MWRVALPAAVVWMAGVVRMAVVVLVRVVVLMLVDEHVDLRPHQRPALHPLARQPIAAHGQLLQLAAHHLFRHAEVEERAERHVPGDAAEAIEVQLAAAQIVVAHVCFRLMSAAA